MVRGNDEYTQVIDGSVHRIVPLSGLSQREPRVRVAGQGRVAIVIPSLLGAEDLVRKDYVVGILQHGL